MIALGLILILAGLAVVMLDAHLSSGGALGIPAVVAMAVGTGLLIGGAGAGPAVAIPVSAVLAGTGVAVVGLGARKIRGVQRSAVRSGPPRLIGTSATVRSWSGREGQVAADGTLWSARIGFGWEQDPAPVAGQSVIIEQLDGLTLSVRPRQSWELDAS